jgi:ribosomal protein S18 acetylase RimI-like enzyme
VSIVYRDDVDVDALAELRRSCGFAHQPPAVIAGQVAGARWTVAAYDGELLVGFARAISDGVTNAYVSSVMVHAGHRRRGIGRELMRRLMAGRDGIRWVLHARADAMAFYRALGFTAAPDMMWRDRRSR